MNKKESILVSLSPTSVHYIRPDLFDSIITVTDHLQLFDMSIVRGKWTHYRIEPHVRGQGPIMHSSISL